MNSLLLLLMSAGSSPWRLLLRRPAAAAAEVARRADVGAPPLPSARRDRPVRAPRPAAAARLLAEAPTAFPEVAPARAIGVLGTAVEACCCRCGGASVFFDVDAAHGLLTFSFPVSARSILSQLALPVLRRLPQAPPHALGNTLCPAERMLQLLLLLL